MSSEEEEEEAYSSNEKDEGCPEEEYGPEDECPPPSQEEKEMLFLIEFLVDNMVLKPENMNLEGMDPCLLQGQTCLMLTFLHFPPMSICEMDVDPCKQTGGDFIKFNAGKSLMFALSESQFENPPPIYLEVSAYKMLPHACVPSRFLIGASKICLIELFKQVFNKVEEQPNKLPLSKSIKDKYQLTGARRKCPTAEVTIYMRLSCLGQNVVTEFQRGGDQSQAYLFRSKESTKTYECKTKDLPIGDDPGELCPPLPGWGLQAGRECGDGGIAGGGVGGVGGGGGGGGKEQRGGDRGYGRDDKKGSGQGGKYGGNGKKEQDANPDEDDEDDYEEFGTEVHGHCLTIKVQKGRRQASERVVSGNEITLQLPQNQNLCNKGSKLTKAAVYNLEEMDGKRCQLDGPVQVVQGIDSQDKDVFVVRIGKKGETDGKGKLELELKTPKVKVERQNEEARKSDKAIQTDKEEQPKKGKGKGKKDKQR